VCSLLISVSESIESASLKELIRRTDEGQLNATNGKCCRAPWHICRSRHLPRAHQLNDLVLMAWHAIQNISIYMVRRAMQPWKITWLCSHKFSMGISSSVRLLCVDSVQVPSSTYMFCLCWLIPSMKNQKDPEGKPRHPDLQLIRCQSQQQQIKGTRVFDLSSNLDTGTIPAAPLHRIEIEVLPQAERDAMSRCVSVLLWSMYSHHLALANARVLMGYIIHARF